MPQTLTLFLLIILALAILWGGAEALVRGATNLALRAGISALAIGLTVVAFGTSAPEMVVSLQAASVGSTDIAVGNVVGSNICNIALILGLAALVKPAVVHPEVYRQNVPLMIVISLVMVGMLATGSISHTSGIILVVGLVAFTGMTFWNSRGIQDDGAAASELHVASGGLVGAILYTIGGLVALVVGGKLFVSSASDVAIALGVSEVVIGLTIVAIGTSLPELATSVVAAARGHSDIAIGNVVGSNIFNILGVLGITAMIQPLPIGNISSVDLGMMLALAILLWLFMHKSPIISRLHGIMLLVIYAAYMGWLAA